MRPEDCVAGGGEMGALMRSFDWAETELGPIHAWPQSLRTAVSIMLDSPFAMVIAWGPRVRLPLQRPLPPGAGRDQASGRARPSQPQDLPRGLGLHRPAL